MDKKIFLLEKSCLKHMVGNLTEKDLEEWVAEEGYDGNTTILKIDANGYDTAEIAMDAEVGFLDLDDYYVFTFGF